VPKTWKQFDEIGSFLTEKLKKDGTYAHRSSANRPTRLYMFQERFRVEGGKFFDANMKATVNSPIGVKVFTEMRNEKPLHAAGRGKVRLR